MLVSASRCRDWDLAKIFTSIASGAMPVGVSTMLLGALAGRAETTAELSNPFVVVSLLSTHNE